MAEGTGVHAGRQLLPLQAGGPESPEALRGQWAELQGRAQKKAAERQAVMSAQSCITNLSSADLSVNCDHSEDFCVLGDILC